MLFAFVPLVNSVSLVFKPGMLLYVSPGGQLVPIVWLPHQTIITGNHSIVLKSVFKCLVFFILETISGEAELLRRQT